MDGYIQKRRRKRFLAALEPGYIQGFTLLGGEPFEPENQVELVHLLQKVRETYPEKRISGATAAICGIGIWQPAAWSIQR